MAVRQCAHCGSEDTELVQRSLISAVVQPHQFWVCRHCGRKTYEIISCTSREIRLHALAPGRTMTRDGQQYTIQRILRAGDREFLVYVSPFPSR